MTREWIAVQEMWTDLSKAFAIKGFKDSIENGAGFEDLNKRYVSLLHVVTLHHIFDFFSDVQMI